MAAAPRRTLVVCYSHTGTTEAVACAGHPKGKRVATLHTSFSSGAEGSRAQAEQLAPDARFVGEPFIALGSGARTLMNEAQARARKPLEEAL